MRQCYFYIANEGISLLENVANIGIPIPNKIRNALEQLNKEKATRGNDFTKIFTVVKWCFR